MTSCRTGSGEHDEVDPRDQQAAEHDPEHDPERGADQRRDHALVPDHPAHLPPRHADRAQHPELARPLEDGEHERVDDPEEADEDRQREQHVEDVQDALERRDLVVDELVAGLRLGVREVLQRRLERRRVRVRLAALILTNVKRFSRVRRCRRRRSRSRSSRGRTASRRSAGRRCPRTTSRSVSPLGVSDDDRRADLQVVVLRVVVVDERAVRRRGRRRRPASRPSSRASAPAALSGSTAVSELVLPKIRASPARTLAIASTPGAFAAASAAPIGIGLKLFCAVIA